MQLRHYHIEASYSLPSGLMLAVLAEFIEYKVGQKNLSFASQAVSVY